VATRTSQAMRLVRPLGMPGLFRPRGLTCGASSRRIGSVAFAPSDTDVLEHSCKIRSWREITPDGFKYSQPEGRQKGCWLMSSLWPRPQQLGWGSFFCGRTISLAN
jgi:hypothetical protein